MKVAIIYPRGMKLKKKKKPDTRKLKGTGAGKMKVIIEEANEDERNRIRQPRQNKRLSHR